MNIKNGTCFLGRTLILDDGFTEITVTLDVGPRIIGLRPVNGFNVMFSDVNDNVNHDCSSVYGESEKWHLYGGHRLWLSPEDETTYYPDNSPVAYSVDGNAVTFTADKRRIVEALFEITVTLNGENGVTVTHRVKNLGKKRSFSLWALTALKSGGTLVIPLSTENTGYLANRTIVMWHYSSFNDERLTVHDDRIMLKSDIGVPKPFKLGTFCKNTELSYELEENGTKQVFIKSVEVATDGTYPDYNCNVETYCSHLFHEIETLSAFKEIDEGDFLTHTEHWIIK